MCKVSELICSLVGFHLLDLLFCLGFHPAFSQLFSLWSSFGVQNKVPPSETGRVRADKEMVVLIVVISTGPERKEVVQRPREFVTRVGIDSLEQSQADPKRNGEQVQVSGEVAPNQGNSNGSHAQKCNFDRMSILSRQAKWGSIAVVLLVNVLVKDSVVQAPVEPVMPSVFQHKEKPQLEQDFRPRRERNQERHADLFTERVEKPDGEGLHQEMRCQDRFKTLPLLGVARQLRLLDLVLAEVWDTIDNGPGQTSAKVHDLVHQEEEQSSGQNIIVHPIVVGGPEFLDWVQTADVTEVLVRLGKRRCVRKPTIVVIDSAYHAFVERRK